MAPHRKQVGFTLFEILVVVVLISISVTMLVANIDPGTDDLAELEARRLASMIEQLKDEAIIRATPFAIVFDADRRQYRFLVAKEGWVPVQNDDLLVTRHLPEPLRLEYDQQALFYEDLPMLQVDTIGGVSPFSVIVKGGNTRYRVYLNESQHVAVEEKPSDAG
jgi:type II secretion system protein H